MRTYGRQKQGSGIGAKLLGCGCLFVVGPLVLGLLAVAVMQPGTRSTTPTTQPETQKATDQEQEKEPTGHYDAGRVEREARSNAAKEAWKTRREKYGEKGHK